MFKKSDAKKCPFNKMKPCVGDECMFFLHIRGKEKNTGKDVDHPDCAMRWMPQLMIEGNQINSSNASAAEGLRNEVKESNETNKSLIAAVKDMILNISRSVNKQIMGPR